MKPSPLLVENVLLVGLSQPASLGWLLAKDGIIAQTGRGDAGVELRRSVERVINGNGNYLLPGFIDLHTHGAIGHEFMEADEEVWQTLSRFYVSHGVTGVLASTWTAPDKAICAVLDTARQVMGKETGARILGVHLEGPYINRARAGAQDPMYIRTANHEEAMRYLDSGLIRLIAIAPELPENQWLIAECVRRSITVSAGHTDASYDEMAAAAAMGVTQVTHCFNAMRPMTHRQPGTVGAALVLPQIRCELIADNIHIHPAVMKLMARARGLDGVILITDSIMGAGMPDGEFMLEGQKVFLRNGQARLADGTLAGSTLTMERGLLNFMEAAEIPIEQAWICTSLNAARAIHLDDHKGSLDPGKDADLVLLDENYQARMTLVEGNVVYEAA